MSAVSPREYHARRDAEIRRQREDLRLQVLDRARSAIRRLAPEFPPIQAVYLFGSVVQPGQFSVASDVDVAVDCEDITAETPFWRALEMALERNVVLLPRQGTVAQTVELYGELCYQRDIGEPPPSAFRG